MDGPARAGEAREAQEALQVALLAARAAGEVLRDAWETGGAHEVDHKGAVDLVTEVDVRAEQAVRDVLERHSPGVPVLAEEQGGAWGQQTRWIVDPLDGTTNFVHGLPHFAVSVALQVDGVLRAGVVLDPSRQELWAAARGAGATCNGRPIHVSPTRELSQALLATGFPYDRRTRAAEYLRPVQAFLERCQGIRRAGAAALDLAWVAGGRLDGFWELGLKPWDVAAGALLVQEAGGRVGEMEGGPLCLETPRTLASNGHVHAAMEQVLAPLLRSAGRPPEETA